MFLATRLNSACRLEFHKRVRHLPQVNMELGSIDRQILAVKEDLTLKKVQVRAV